MLFTVNGTCESLFSNAAAVKPFVEAYVRRYSATVGIDVSDVQVDQISCIARSGARKTFKVTAAQGGRRLLLVEVADGAIDATAGAGLGIGRRLAQADNAINLGITFQLTSAGIARMEALAATGTGIDLNPAIAAAVAEAFPASVGAALLAVSVAPLQASSPDPSASAPKSVTVWANSAYSKRYSKGRINKAVLGYEKAVGAPQMLAIARGAPRCASSLGTAWGPTMARPRVLEVYFNGSSTVAASRVASVVVAINYLGASAAPLQSIDLLLQPAGSSTTPTAVNVYTHHAGDAKPSCPALNTYALPASVFSGPNAGARIVGVRLRPTQERVRSKGALMQVRAQWPASAASRCNRTLPILKACTLNVVKVAMGLEGPNKCML